MIKAYLSYRREEGELSPLAKALLDWAPDDIELKVDCRDAALSRHINEFLAELESSPSVVFLLNKDYFRSPWCMGELRAFLERYKADHYGFFIACEGWGPVPGSGDFFTQETKELVDHWRGRAEQTDDGVIKDEAQEFADFLPKMIDIIQGLNLPNEELIREKKAQQVWERIKEQHERVKSDYQPRNAATLHDECRDEIERRLQNMSRLREELAAECRLDRGSGANEVVDRLWEPQTGLANQLSSLYRAAKQALKNVDAERREGLRADLRELLGLALLGMLDGQARDQAITPHYGFLDTDYLEVSQAEQDDLVELCFATAQEEFCPRLEYDQRLGRLKVPDDRYYEKNRVEQGAQKFANNVIDAQLGLVWGLHFPNKPKRPGESLDQEEIKRLAASLKRNFERGKARYFLVPHADVNHPLNQAGVISALKRDLPYLFVFRTGVPGLPSLIAADFDAFEIEDELESFAELFK